MNPVHTRLKAGSSGELKTIRVDRVVLGGAGNRIHALLGALYTLRSSLTDCHHFIGVSAGSIISTFLALNCTVKNIVLKERENPFTFRWYWIGSIAWRLFWHGDGLIPLSELHHYLSKSLQLMVPDIPVEKITFEYIFEKYSNTLEIQAMNLQTGESVVFNRKLTPMMMVIDAMVASCAIPFVFSPCIHKGQILCDSAIISGIPWNSVFASHSNLFMDVANDDSDSKTINPETIGILLSDVEVHKKPSCQRSLLSSSLSSSLESVLQSAVVPLWSCLGTIDEYYNRCCEYIWPSSSVSWSWYQILYLPFQRLRHQECLGKYQKNLIYVFVDPQVYGSKAHSLWPSKIDKRKLFRQGKKDASLWLELRIGSELKENT